MRGKEAATVSPQVEQFSEEFDRVLFETITNKIQPSPDIRVLDKTVGILDKPTGLRNGHIGYFLRYLAEVKAQCRADVFVALVISQVQSSRVKVELLTKVCGYAFRGEVCWKGETREVLQRLHS